MNGQKLLDFIGEELGIEYEVVSNLGSTCKSKITLVNKGDKTIPKGDWALYLSHMSQIESNNIQIDIDHIVGGLFKVYPTEQFAGIDPGKQIEVIVSSDEPTVSRSSIFPNWYVAQVGFVPRTIKSTADETLSFVGEFDSAEKWKKGTYDKINPLTPQERYKKYYVTDQGESVLPVLPSPLICQFDKNKLINLSEEKWVIHNDCASFENEAKLLSKQLKLTHGVGPGSHVIRFKQGDIENTFDSKESYKIEIKHENPCIEITAGTSTGAFYAVQTMLSLLKNPPNSNESMIFPSGILIDAPRFPYRGIHIDVARNFVKPEEIMKLIEVISMYKLNKLHFHLTDDEGWRLEIKDLPELVEIGAKRDHELSLKGLAVEPTLGSGPDYKSPSCGFYTVEDYQNILRCAKKHHVEVIPEIDMPGHSYAAVVAMTARYNKFKNLGNMEAATEYMLIDPTEEVTYSSDQKYTNNTINPCLEGSKRFVSKIISTLKHLHESIQPLQVFHVGGDEVPLGAWDDSSICREYYKEHKLDGLDPYMDEGDEYLESRKMTSAMEEYFINYVEDICKQQNLQMAVWNDGIRDPTLKQETDKPKLVHAWRISRKNERHNPNILANSGYQVVISSATHTYFDHPYEPDPEENGLTWCVRVLDTKTVFGMKPCDMYACQKKKFSKIEHEKLKNKSAIIGIQSQIWGEVIRSENMLEEKQFPRLLALAERAWHEASWELEANDSKQQEDWGDFANTVGYKEFTTLEKIGVNYRIPPPGICIKDDKVLVTSVYPGQSYQYRKLGDTTWQDMLLPADVKLFEKGCRYEFATYSQDKSRQSRMITMLF